MNWPEHLLTLHRLTGNTWFGFSSDRGRIEVIWRPRLKLWRLSFPGRLYRIVDNDSLQDALSGLLNVQLVSAVP